MAENNAFLKHAILGYVFFPYALFVLLKTLSKNKDKRLAFHAAQSLFLWSIGLLLSYVLGLLLRSLGELVALLMFTAAIFAVIKLLKDENPRLPFFASLAEKAVNKE